MFSTETGRVVSNTAMANGSFQWKRLVSHTGASP
jgi:hypothetical protein